MRTFEVSKVELASTPRKALDRDQAVAALLSVPAPQEAPADDDAASITLGGHGKRLTRVEQAYATDARLVACTDVSPLVQMAHDAFYEHRPIALSPDALWFTIAQGFATHVHLNAEALRFVAGMFGVVESEAGVLSPAFGWAITYDDR